MFGWAINTGHVALLRVMLSGGSDLRNFIISKAQLSVMAAAKEHSTEFIETLCEVSGLSLRDLPMDEIVCDAASEGRDEFLEALLRLDADPNAKTDEGRSAVVCAFLRKQYPASELLLQYGADPDISLCRNDFHGLEFRTFGPGYISAQDTCPLLFLAARGGHTALVRALLRAGANVNLVTYQKTDCSETPLQAAVEGGHHEIVKMLLEFKAEVNYFSRTKPTALQLAVHDGNTQLVKLLLSANADPDLNADGYWREALYHAAHSGCIDIVRLLLKAGANVKHYRLFGKTPLHAAAKVGHVDG